jgi:hypothetical protein
LRDGEGTTAARGSRMAPSRPNASVAIADHNAASPRKSRRGIGSGSSREGVDTDAPAGSLMWPSTWS